MFDMSVSGGADDFLQFLQWNNNLCYYDSKFQRS